MTWAKFIVLSVGGHSTGGNTQGDKYITKTS